MLSTLFFVYTMGLGWSSEGNITVRYWGPYIGNLNAALANHLMIAFSAYLIGLIFRNRHRGIYIFIYYTLIMSLSAATLSNIIFLTLEVLMK